MDSDKTMAKFARNWSGLPRLSPGAGFALFAVRGLLLWILVPLAVLAWPVALLAKGEDPSLGAWIGWVDLNLVAALVNGFLLMFADAPMRWTPFREAAHVTHRVGWLDPW